MAMKPVTARIIDTETKEVLDECTVDFNVPENVQEALDLYGEEVVYSRFHSSLIIDLQSIMRGKMRKDPRPEDEEIQKTVNEWTPGVKQAPMSKVEKSVTLLDKLTEDELQEVLARYTG